MYGLLGPTVPGQSTLMRILATLQSGRRQRQAHGRRRTPIDVLNQKDDVRRHSLLAAGVGVYPKVNAEELLDHFALSQGHRRRAERQR